VSTLSLREREKERIMERVNRDHVQHALRLQIGLYGDIVKSSFSGDKHTHYIKQAL